MSVGKAKVIVVGNEKGGSGKSTVSMHIAIGLLRLGYKVGTVDLDSHQASLTSYLKNRWRYVAEGFGKNIPSPEHIHIDRADDNMISERSEEERWRVETVVSELAERNDFVIVDTPGSDMYMSMVGHSLADILVTPMNDSFVDLDVIAKVNPADLSFAGASIYTKMVDDLKARRIADGKDELSWFVMRNRLSPTDTNNKQDIGGIVDSLQHELGFTLVGGFSERVIFRELFLQGITLLDLKEGAKNVLSMSNINARQEVRNLVRNIIPKGEVSTLSLLKTYENVA